MKRAAAIVLLVLLAASLAWMQAPSRVDAVQAEPDSGMEDADVERSDAGKVDDSTDEDGDGQAVQELEPDEAREMRGEMRDLEEAWADGGGTFGYPFWDKAGARWRTGQISTAIYREYVTGYRDRLVVGCELLDSVDVATEPASEVRDLAQGACERRVEALRAQQRWLDELIEAAVADGDAEVEAAERAAGHEAEAREALQESWRDARLATNLAQESLDRARLDRLAEDAFL